MFWLFLPEPSLAVWDSPPTSPLHKRTFKVRGSNTGPVEVKIVKDGGPGLSWFSGHLPRPKYHPKMANICKHTATIGINIGKIPCLWVQTDGWVTTDLLERDFGILRQETLKKLPKVRRLEQSWCVYIYISHSHSVSWCYIIHVFVDSECSDLWLVI